MDQRTDELKRDIEERRNTITQTVDQIENRVHPGHIAARNTYRVKSRLASWKDNIMGSDEPDWGDTSAGMGGAMKQAPDAMMRRTRGNPIAAGAIALGAGALLSSLIPQTRSERRMGEKIQPGLDTAAAKIADAGRDVAGDVGEAAKERMSHVTESVKAAGQELIDDAKSAGQHMMDKSSPGKT